MAKPKQKNIALKLRSQGRSINEISVKLGIAKSTVSVWCRDIKLTKDQIERLDQKMKKRGYIGRLKGARMQHERRLQKIENFRKKGYERMKELSDKEFLIAGLSLYLGEGSRKHRQVSFSNSDPEIIQFIMKWFREILKIKEDRFTFYVGINEIHKNRVKEVESYWSRITKTPRRQFRKTTLIKAKNKKDYKNFQIHYGTLTTRVSKSGDLFYEIMGLIHGMIRSKIRSKKE